MKKMRVFKYIPMFIISLILVSLVAINVTAGTNRVDYGFRGKGHEQSPIGKSNTGATITVTPVFTTTDKNGDTVGAIRVVADPETPYKNTRVSLQWWTDDSLISVKKADITMYEGQLGWSPNSMVDVNFPLTARAYTANNNHKQKNGHWTYEITNINNGLYTYFSATITNWATN